MSKSALAMALVGLVFVPVPGPVQNKKVEYNEQAELDAQGNVYVSSDSGRLMKMADNGHCLEVRVADDKQTVGCMVWLKSGEPMQSLQLEIYLKGGQKKTIEPGAPIGDWHFWKGGQQVAVCSKPRDGSGTYALYDTASGHLIEKLAEPPDERMLPQWAKSNAEIQDESVPVSAALAEERTKWIAKVMRQIGKIKAGMRRGDLSKMFTTEGVSPIAFRGRTCMSNAHISKWT